LSRQILATLIANDLVNRMGPSFVRRIQVDTRADVVTIARAYTIARQICQAGPLWSTIEELDNELPATVQVTLMFEISRSLRHASYWLIERFGSELAIKPAVDRLKDNMKAIYTRTGSIMSTPAQDRHQTAAEMYIDMGVPDKLAQQMSALLLTRPALDMSDLAASYKPDALDLARLYAATNEKLGIYWLHVAAEDLTYDDRWQAIARSQLRDEFFKMRRELAEQILRRRGKLTIKEAVDKWLAARADKVERFMAMIEEMKLRPDIDFATLSVAAQQLRDLIAD
jgi:glutamate dehydrogenase